MAANNTPAIVIAVKAARDLKAAGAKATVYNVLLRYAIEAHYECKVYATNLAKQAPKSEQIVEHVVPLRVIRDALFALDEVNDETVKDVLDRLYVLCIVTKTQDDLLKEHKSTMPKNWNGVDVWARYRAAGLKVI